ncbi:MAG TPA: hypothetical protein VLV83_16890, partial [Acidobacteriota bacterium]|nr:hypothetical protein [Acidobacteriota bacterium]
GGDELPLIQEAQDRNDLKAMEADQVTAVIQGRGDPTLKSGASPSSLQMLLNESGKKFGKVDRNYREELDELFMFQLELIQQYADPKLFYRMMPERGAQEMTRLKMIQRPDGDLREQWKISVRAPSAETNPEVKQTQLTIFYNLTTQHLQTLLTVAQQVWSQTDPARLERVTEEALVFLHALYKQLKDYARIGPIGVPMPDVDPKPIDETINQLYQQFAQLEQELTQARQQNAQMQMMMQPEGVPGGGPMAGMA